MTTICLTNKITHSSYALGFSPFTNHYIDTSYSDTNITPNLKCKQYSLSSSGNVKTIAKLSTRGVYAVPHSPERMAKLALRYFCTLAILGCLGIPKRHLCYSDSPTGLRVCLRDTVQQIRLCLWQFALLNNCSLGLAACRAQNFYSTVPYSFCSSSGPWLRRQPSRFLSQCRILPQMELWLL